METIHEMICCSICLSPLLEEEDTTHLRCTHGFHTVCILAWLRHRASCPLCRRPVIVRPGIAVPQMIVVDAFILMVVLVFTLNLYIFLLLYIGWILEKKMVSVRYMFTNDRQWVLLNRN